MSPLRRQRRGGPVRSLFAALTCLLVLGVTFALGVLAGHHWPRAAGGPASVVAAARETLGRRGAPIEPRRAEPSPKLTFYEELTAPLTPAPAAVRAKPGAKRDEPHGPAKDLAEATPVNQEPATGKEPATAAKDGTARFTVQVGAFAARPPAEAMSAALRRAGHDAYVAEIAGGPARYRVRVGSFSTRDAGRDAAARLGRERNVATYVTAR